jgi:hypothetical protein
MVARRFMRVPLVFAILAGLALLAPAVAAAKTRCVVPRVAGQTLAKAELRLKDAHCVRGKVQHPKLKHGQKASSFRVLREVPKAGKRTNGKVKLVLAMPVSKVAVVKPKVSYSTSVDPTFTQSPTNPLEVTYAVSADAVETINGTTENLATTGQLPAGILNFFSQGTLECALNVGGSDDGGACTVTYPTTGTFTVETEYVPNTATAVEETEQETIGPYATTTILTATPDSCGSLLPPTVSTPVNPNLDLQENCYELSLASTAPSTPSLTVSPVGTGGVNPSSVTAGTSCEMVVYWYQSDQQQAGLAGASSPDCPAVEWTDNSYTLPPGTSTYIPVNSWTLTAAFSGTPGWLSSSSAMQLQS